jgi:AcrR family transcriptional regulator
MARTVDREAHAVKRDAFIDAALALIQTKGYAALSINDVLDAIGASKGAFYHYFGSKQALLEAAVDRTAAAAALALRSIVDDPDLSATAKLECLFAAGAQFKADRRDLVIAVLEAWRSDENALFREKYRRSGMSHVAPLMTRIVEQGVAAGEFAAVGPHDLAPILIRLMQAFGDELSELFVLERHEGTLAAIERTVATFTLAVERVLGLPPGTLHLMDPGITRDWYEWTEPSKGAR